MQGFAAEVGFHVTLQKEEIAAVILADVILGGLACGAEAEQVQRLASGGRSHVRGIGGLYSRRRIGGRRGWRIDQEVAAGLARGRVVHRVEGERKFGLIDAGLVEVAPGAALAG